MESKSKNSHNGDYYFQMPVHYPRYTMNDYQKMPEWQLDRLLAEYGLPTTNFTDLDSKREMAMGAFLWPDFHQEQKPRKLVSSRTCNDIHASSSQTGNKKLVKVVEFLYKLTNGFA